MRKFKHWIAASFLCLSAFSQALYAQMEKIDRNEWLVQMKNEELKIGAFVKEQMKNTVFNDSLKHRFLSAEKNEEIQEADLPAWAEGYLKNYYRQEYLKLYPEVLKIYNPGRVSSDEGSQTQGAHKPTDAGTSNILCKYGDFESASPANLGPSGFTGYAGPTYYYYSGGLCNFIPSTNVTYPNVGFSDPDNFLVTDNIADPNVPQINQTHNGSKHAIRINGYKRCDKFGINMLQKSFSSPISGKARINFSYALVIQGPHDGGDSYGNAFFVARILDDNGVEVGSRICVPGDATGPGFQSTELPDCRHTAGYKAHTLWRDWDCDFIDFDIEANRTYTIEFFVSGCKWTVHYGYAYVDDICADVKCCHVPPPPQNLKCTPFEGGSTLTWDPVPGAAYYKVFLVHNYQACCGGPKPPNPITSEYITNTINMTVTDSVVKCFSWKVMAVMPDNCETLYSDKMCSCWPPPPPPPTDLKCKASADGSNLSWSPVSGAAYYKVYIVHNYQVCCPGPYPTNPVITEYITNTPNMTVTSSASNCFSWKVMAVMQDSIETLYSSKMCSCSPVPPPPANPVCTPSADGSSLSWNAVPGAAYYKVYIIHDYQACCPGPYPPNPVITEYTTSIPSMIVTNATVTCFSWKVMAVMADGTETLYSAKMCSCTPRDPRESYEAKPVNGSTPAFEKNMSVTAVPNPASNYIEFTVHIQNKEISRKGLTLYLYDVNGREIIKKEMNDQSKLRLDVHSYTNGMYIYEIRDKDKVLYKNKIIVE